MALTLEHLTVSNDPRAPWLVLRPGALDGPQRAEFGELLARAVRDPHTGTAVQEAIDLVTAALEHPLFGDSVLIARGGEHSLIVALPSRAGPPQLSISPALPGWAQRHLEGHMRSPSRGQRSPGSDAFAQA